MSAAPRRDLVRYLEGFAHTVGVMQTPDALERVAAECVEDLCDDGVVYAEVRFAPSCTSSAALTLEDVVESVLAGFDAAMARAAAAGRPIVVRTLLTAMRTAARSREIAELAVRYRDAGVAGFDVAGPEAGYPPTAHLDAFHLVQRENFHATLHAGEAFGLPSIWQAIQWCNAERLGHGVRIVDDIVAEPDGEVALGRLASYVRDRRVPLEMCPTSNVHTGAAPSLAEHPIGLLRRLSFRVTVNTDNRLMSGVTLSSELAALVETFDWSWKDLNWLTINAMKSAFYPFDERLALIERPDQAGLRGARPRRRPAGDRELTSSRRACSRNRDERAATSSRRVWSNRFGLMSRLGHAGHRQGCRHDLEVGLQLRLGAARP